MAHTNNVSAMTIVSTGRVNLPQLIAFAAYVNDGNGVDVDWQNKVHMMLLLLIKAMLTILYVFNCHRSNAGILVFFFLALILHQAQP